MTWVKVCGLRDSAAVEVAAESGADAFGLVLHKQSSRYVSTHDARALAQAAPIPAYIVTVDLVPEEALALAETVGAAGIQNHGMHASAVAQAALDAGFRALLPIPVDASGPLAVGAVEGAPPLYDTAVSSHGGSGRTFEWSLLDGVAEPFVLAGGLGPTNVRRAIEAVRPFGVDASTGLESAPGVKDPDSIRSFVREAKQA